MAEAAGIFVSHAHEDSAWCRAFVQALRTAGADVWYDEHNLGYGALREVVERELRARPIFVVILSPTSVGKPWVGREMDAAITLQDRNRERIILPVVAEETEIPLLWMSYKRVSGPGDTGLSATEAARRVVHTLAIVPAGTPAAPVPVTATETAAEAYERGKGLYAQKRYSEALAAYERATFLEEWNATYWAGKGDALRALEIYHEAYSAYEQALALDPRNASAWTGKGVILCDPDDRAPDEAFYEGLAALEHALALDPQNASAWTNMAHALFYRMRYREMLAASERAVALDPQNADVWKGMSESLYWCERYEEALAACERALTLDPRNVDSWQWKAGLLGEMRHTAKDAEDAEDAES